MPKMRVAKGSLVLNQSTTNPMCGNVLGWNEECRMLRVLWCDGQETEEIESDVTLTGKLYLEEEVPTAARVIKLPSYGIEITVDGDSGSITSLMKDPDDDNSEAYHYAVDGIESLLLAMACAGVELNTPAMLEAIETAVENCSNKL